ncbi:glutathione-S-transferase [Dentipellis sp. KUC8613]|nr:glutathione-S-transferase [Dentipellis sp. KUC8613]
MAVPDADIFPHATAEAEKTVAQHQEPQDLVFYAGWFCPFVQRSWIALEEKGIPYQYKEVNPYHKEKEFLDINPKGLVPALVYKGKPLYESLIISEFLEDAYPSYTPHLLPTDPFARAHARLWTDYVAKNVVPANQRLVQAQEPERRAAALQELIGALKTVAAEKAKAPGPYFLGEEWSLVDTALAPWVVRDYVVRENRGFRREDVGEEWVQYAHALETRPSVLKTQSDRKHLEPIYGRYLRDEAQSEAAKATRAGRSFS